MLNELQEHQKLRYLDELYYYFAKQRYDFELAYFYLDNDKKVVSSAWRRYTDVCFDKESNKDFLLKANNRTILPNEIVIDIENKNLLNAVLSELDKEKLCYYIYDTYSRGFHIHLFFDKKLTTDAKMNFLSKLNADIQKAGERVMIALEFAEHYKSMKTKQLIKAVLIYSNTAGINNARQFFDDNDIEKEKIELNIDEQTENYVEQEARKFRADKIKEILSKNEITDFERDMLNRYYKYDEFKQK